MGNMAGYRTAWIEAAEYTDGMNEKDSDRRPTRDLAMDTLMGVLNGEILIQNHCYRACLLYTSPSPRDRQKSRMPSSA